MSKTLRWGLIVPTASCPLPTTAGLKGKGVENTCTVSGLYSILVGDVFGYIPGSHKRTGMELLLEILKTFLFLLFGLFSGYVIVRLLFKPVIVILCFFLFMQLFSLLGVTAEGPIKDDLIELLYPVKLLFIYCGQIAAMVYQQSSLASKVLFYAGFILACLSLTYNKNKPIRQKMSKKSDL